ncbi:Short-chain dehydrogenase [Emericellopsis cladophorae]|uniref:Short-chain dehydrogenase n=1 Tax=Emericellopsis cladophorae TaxID=2686198 RepID=A0A9P9XV08_9HYPO|nr:Short-chain dehydrogenase [Emericellopsis cladophorae]KAI6777975.1 Short-chain dehydrogenase [Emericellopsis cladophorae]
MSGSIQRHGNMATQWNPVKDMPDLLGKVAVVTGATSGIGFHTVKHLAAKGAKVYFTARNEAKARKTQGEQLKLNPELSAEQLPWLLVDFEEIESAARAAELLGSKEDKVDILVNNAGGPPRALEHSSAGWEKSMASSHIGHFVFTNRVLPLLKKAAASPDADVRIVVVSSNAMHLVLPPNYALDFTKSELLYGTLPYTPLKYKLLRPLVFDVNMLHYAVSKLANAMFAKQLQRNLRSQRVPIAVLSLHPGGVASDRIHEVFKPWVWPLVSGNFMPQDTGSHASLFAATAKEIRVEERGFMGNYMEPIGVVHAGHPLLHDEAQARDLWETTQKEASTYLKGKGHGGLLLVLNLLLSMEDTFTWAEVGSAFKNSRMYLRAVLGFLVTLSLFSLVAFLPAVIRGLARQPGSEAEYAGKEYTDYDDTSRYNL